MCDPSLASHQNHSISKDSSSLTTFSDHRSPPSPQQPQRSISQEKLKRFLQTKKEAKPILDFDSSENASQFEAVSLVAMYNSPTEQCNGQSDLMPPVTVPGNGTSNDDEIAALNDIRNQGDQCAGTENLTNNQEHEEAVSEENANHNNDLNLAKYAERKRAGSISVANPKKTKNYDIRKHAPSLLIIESLVWNICSLHEKDFKKRVKMFISLCQSLSHFNVLGESYKEESLLPLRDKISSMFNVEIYRLKSDDQINGGNNHYSPASFPRLDLNFLTQSHHNSLSDTNRYIIEFEEINTIARGGFGVVKKARHRFDKCVYAVKEISFPYKNSESFSQIIREVKLYANLEPHPNVVAYKTAWIQSVVVEHTQRRRSTAYFGRTRSSSKTYRTFQEVSDEDKINEEAEKEVFNCTFTEGKSSNSNFSSQRNETDNEDTNDGNDQTSSDSSKDTDDSLPCNRSSDNSDKSDDFVSFEASHRSEISTMSINYSRSAADVAAEDLNNSSSPNEDDDDEESSDEDESSEEEDNDDDAGTNTTVDEFYYEKNVIAKNVTFCNLSDFMQTDRRFSAVLYIQMELCGMNLREYLDKRNAAIMNRLSSGDDPLDHVNINEECHHFEQILNGVQYIHSQSMIHRDLKPQNILFSLDGKRLKIGDFGLATLHQQAAAVGAATNEATSLVEESLANTRKISLQHSSSVKHTTGLGTTIYAAPEQRNEFHRAYDHRVDMYSLGIILFELFNPTNTDMERIDLLKTLKNEKKLPANFAIRWPKLGDLILRLTSHSAEARPKSVAEISALLKHSFGYDSTFNIDLTANTINSTTTNTAISTVEEDDSDSDTFVSPLSSPHHDVTQVLQENEHLKRLILEKDERIRELEQMIEQMMKKKKKGCGENSN